MSNTIIVFFNLQPNANESDYLSWAKEVDLPTVNKLNSVSSFEVYKGLNILGQEQNSPWDYFEVIQVSSEAEFVEDIQTAEMQQVVKQFQTFAQDAQFVLTQNISRS